MPIKFHTKNINERLYTRLLRDFVYDMFDGADQDYRDFMNRWYWEFYPSDKASEDPNFHGQDGVGGVTGMEVVKVYIEDKKTDLIHDIFKRVLRKNFLVITHEGCHAILIFKRLTHKVALRHADFSGHKAGTMLNFSTAEVHDRHTEGRFKTKSVWFWDWKTLRPSKVTIQYVDIDDLV